MPKKSVQSAEDRFKRYQKAKDKMLNWHSIFVEAYQYALPNRNDWNVKTKGQDRTQQIYDSTAVLGLEQYANNLLSILMPPFRDWLRLEPGPEIPQENREAVNRALQPVNQIITNSINRSNLTLAAAESFQEAGISTGIMQVTEGDDDSPLNFESIPLSSMVVEEGPNAKIENFRS